MKVTKEKLQKIIQEELATMQQEGEVDEALGTFLKSFGAGAKDVAKSAASGISGAISAAKEASKKADMEAEKAKQEAKLAAERVKTDSDVESVIKTIRKQVSGALESLTALRKKMTSKELKLNMPIDSPTLNLNLIIRQLTSAHTTLLHAGKVPEQLPKGQGVPGFDTTKRPERPIRGAREARQQEQEEE